jgi:hypothetical protein
MHSFFTDEELIEEGIELNYIKNKDYIKAKGVIDNIDLFDAFFLISTLKKRNLWILSIGFCWNVHGKHWKMQVMMLKGMKAP